MEKRGFFETEVLVLERRQETPTGYGFPEIICKFGPLPQGIVLHGIRLILLAIAIERPTLFC